MNGPRPQSSEGAPRHSRRAGIGGLMAFALLSAALEIDSEVVQKPLNHWGEPSGDTCLNPRR
jgi:hypothetical protein